MRPLVFGAPVGVNPQSFQQWTVASFKKLEQATYEDLEIVFDAYTVTGDFTPTRTLDVDTATPADVVALIATLITDVKKRGPNRTD